MRRRAGEEAASARQEEHAGPCPCSPSLLVSASPDRASRVLLPSPLAALRHPPSPPSMKLAKIPPNSWDATIRKNSFLLPTTGAAQGGNVAYWPQYPPNIDPRPPPRTARSSQNRLQGPRVQGERPERFRRAGKTRAGWAPTRLRGRQDAKARTTDSQTASPSTRSCCILPRSSWPH
jgi:hypothetical protein